MITTATLSQHPFLHDMPEDQLAALAACAQTLNFEPGEYLFKTGQVAARFFLVMEGTIAVSASADPTALTLYTRGHGDALGWSWVFKDYQWRFTGKALTPVRVLAFEGECLRAMCEADLSFGYEFMKRIAWQLLHSLDATRLQVLDMFRNG